MSADVSTAPAGLPDPARLVIGADGSIGGRSGGYVKHLGEMAGVYRDAVAYRGALARLGADQVVYTVDEHRSGTGAGALIIGTSTLAPGRYGQEFAMTRGHLHALADRAELYYGIAGCGVMLMETLDGRSEAIEITPGVAVHVPGYWVHRSVNVGSEPLVTLFCYPADAGQDYALIERAGGMAQLVIPGDEAGWRTVANPDHRGYQPGYPSS